MPDNGSSHLGSSIVQGSMESGHDRPAFMGFVTDVHSEEAIRLGFADISSDHFDIRRGGIRTAIAAMQKQRTPRLLVVDISDEEHPLTALAELANVVEPDVCVLVIGAVDNVGVYREVTRSLGASEYLVKPIERDAVMRYFGGYLEGQTQKSQETPLGGRAIAVTGAGGGVGATTLTVNLAWYLGVSMHRHTVLLDPNLHLGGAAFLLNAQPGTGLGKALEAPDRIDGLLAERAAVQAADRLHLLAGQDAASATGTPAPGAAASLIEALRRRYNFIVADVPFAPVPLYRDLLDIVDQRVFTMEPTLASVKNMLHLLELPKSPNQTSPAIVVLNRVGRPGGLTRAQVEDALSRKVDIAIPDLPRPFENAATLGEPAVVSVAVLQANMQCLTRLVAATRLLDALADAPQASQADIPHSRWWSFGRAF